MNCLPVIDMEMRSASRRNWTFTVRLLFGLAGAATCLVVMIQPRLAGNEKGRVMLVILSYLSLGFCLAIGGFLTADCISSEKREGTLGLLLLTPLKGTDIVLGKMVSHGAQVLYGLCALFPVFFLAVLAGGVTWGEVSRILVALGLSLLLAQSVGVLVSVFAMEARQAMLAALSIIALTAALPMVYWLLWKIFMTGTPRVSGVLPLSPIFAVFSAFESNYSTAQGHLAYWSSVMALLVLSVVVVGIAGGLLGRVFAKMGSIEACTERPRVLPRRTDALERNPYEWLMLRNAAEGRSPGPLLGLGVGLFVVMFGASVLTAHWRESFSAAFFTALAIHLIAKLRFAVEATRQVNTDFSQRTLELLLLTSLTEENIVEGHRSALHRVARRPLALLSGLNLVLELAIIVLAEPLHIDGESAAIFSAFFIGGIVLAAVDFPTLSWLGLLNGLKRSTHVKAALKTYSTIMLLPWIGIAVVMSIVFDSQPKAGAVAVVLWLWVIGCLIYDCLLIRRAAAQLQGGLRRLISQQT